METTTQQLESLSLQVLIHAQNLLGCDPATATLALGMAYGRSAGLLLSDLEGVPEEVLGVVHDNFHFSRRLLREGSVSIPNLPVKALNESLH